jgi:hypothetical protein
VAFEDMFASAVLWGPQTNSSVFAAGANEFSIFGEAAHRNAAIVAREDLQALAIVSQPHPNYYIYIMNKSIIYMQKSTPNP